MADAAYVWGTGRRKTAIAQVRLYAGNGEINVNGKPHAEVFPRLELRRMVESPLQVTDLADKFRVEVKVQGGGISAQAGAIRLGIARALVRESVALKPILRKEGFLTRDPRVKERKKPGLRRARKAPQYTKR
ncbi:MAG TPA: 30S ribosomal protein S9 [Dehalococcoidia bacterium]|nr:30S ribosomal protein S9 [Dehalococcoidia bacterium]